MSQQKGWFARIVDKLFGLTEKQAALEFQSYGSKAPEYATVEKTTEITVELKPAPKPELKAAPKPAPRSGSSTPPKPAPKTESYRERPTVDIDVDDTPSHSTYYSSSVSTSSYSSSSHSSSSHSCSSSSSSSDSGSSCSGGGGGGD